MHVDIPMWIIIVASVVSLYCIIWLCGTGK